MPLSRSPACSRLAIGSNWSEVIAFGLLLPWRPPAQILPVWRIDRVAKLSVTREEEEGGGQYFKVAALVEMDPLSLSARLSLLLQAVNQRSPPPLSAAVAQEICDVAVRNTGVKLPACCLRYRCDIVCSWKAQLCIQLSELPGLSAGLGAPSEWPRCVSCALPSKSVSAACSKSWRRACRPRVSNILKICIVVNIRTTLTRRWCEMVAPYSPPPPISKSHTDRLG